MTEYTRRVLLVVPAADQARANTAALAYDPVGGSETFTSPLSADGGLPATHYCCCTSMREATYQAVTALVAAQFPGATMTECSVDGSGTTAQAVLAGLGLQFVRADG